jgi:hypothetical protein
MGFRSKNVMLSKLDAFSVVASHKLSTLEWNDH